MSVKSTLTDLTLIEVADGIKSGKFSSEEVTMACLERGDKAQPSLNCFISVEGN